MKKIFTLLSGLFLAVAVMAADRGPDLTIRSSKNYKIVIDGRTFFSRNSLLRINDLPRGMHNIRVYEMKTGRGLFGNRERLVSSKSFRMNKKDVRILIDYAGRINVMQDRDIDRNDRDRRNNDRDDRYDVPRRF
jgi:hypothetical protein